MIIYTYVAYPVRAQPSLCHEYGTQAANYSLD